MDVTLNQNITNRSVYTYLSTASVLTAFLFYIDEGYYSFAWMKSLGAWIVFFIYVVLLFLGQCLVHYLVNRAMPSLQVGTISIILGCFLALTLVFYIFS